MRKKILVVEDDKDIQEYYSVVLSDFDVDILIANNGKEGLSIVDSGQKIDLIILDIVMPVMDGEEFLRELRHQRKDDTPIVISSVDNISANRLREVAEVQGMFFKLGRLDEFLSLVETNLNH